MLIELNKQIDKIGLANSKQLEQFDEEGRGWFRVENGSFSVESLNITSENKKIFSTFIYLKPTPSSRIQIFAGTIWITRLADTINSIIADFVSKINADFKKKCQ